MNQKISLKNFTRLYTIKIRQCRNLLRTRGISSILPDFTPLPVISLLAGLDRPIFATVRREEKAMITKRKSRNV